MSTSSTLKLALELAAKVTGREDLAALAGEVRELGPVSDETAAETQRLAQTLEGLSQQQALIQQFNDTKAALTQLELATVLSRDKLAQLRAEQQAGTGDAKALADQERLLASEVKQLERQLVSQAASHTRLHAGLTQSGLDTRNLSQEQQRLQRELAQTVAQTERLGRELSQGSQRANGFQGAIGGLTGRLLALVGTWFGLQTLTTQLVAMFQTGDQAERLDVQLKAVMGSIAGGAEASAWIQDFAKNTPLQLDEVTQVFVRLKAFGIDPMAGAMQGIVDQAYKLGGGFEEVQGISLALGQAWAKQKLQGEEILQLIERGVPVWQLLEQVTGKNTAELQKLSEAGKLGRDTIAALMNEIAAQSSGAARDNMSLLSGLISNAQDNLAKFYRLVSESGALDWLKNQLANLNAEFEAMARDGRLQAWAQRLSDGFISLGETLKSLIQTLYEWRTALTVLAQAWVGLKIAGWIGDLRSLYAQFIALPTATATAAGGMTTAGTVAASAAIGVRALGAAVKGLLAAVTVEAIIQITQFAAALRQLVQAELALREAQTLRSETQARLNGQFAALSAELGVAITSMADLDRAVRDGKVHYDEATGSWRQGAAAVKGVQDEAEQTNTSLSSGGGGGNGNTRTVNAGSFYYKSVDINSLRGNADGLANTLAGVEEELARYSQKVKDIPAYSEWSKYYGEKFQKEMEAMRAQLKAELSKAQVKASEQAQTASTSAAGQSDPGSQPPSQAPFNQGQPQRHIIELRGPSGARAEVQADEANANAFISLLKQQGLRS